MVFTNINAQILTLDPPFPTIDDTITIVYDATQGNAALVGQSQLYAHTGLITSESTTPNDWQYVVGNWGTADNDVIMQNLGADLHSISYPIKSYYGVIQECGWKFSRQRYRWVRHFYSCVSVKWIVCEPDSSFRRLFILSTRRNNCD